MACVMWAVHVGPFGKILVLIVVVRDRPFVKLFLVIKVHLVCLSLLARRPRIGLPLKLTLLMPTTVALLPALQTRVMILVSSPSVLCVCRNRATPFSCPLSIWISLGRNGQAAAMSLLQAVGRLVLFVSRLAPFRDLQRLWHVLFVVPVVSLLIDLKTCPPRTLLTLPLLVGWTMVDGRMV